MTAGAAPQRAVTALKGVGPKQGERLARLGITRVDELLFHLPLRYEDRCRIVSIGALASGVEALVEGEIEHAEVASGRRRRLVCRINDRTGSLDLVFFHFYDNQRQALRPGRLVRAFGESRDGPGGPQMVHPEWEAISPEQAGHTAGCLTPVYPTTEGLPQASLRRLVERAIEQSLDGLQELLPAPTRAELDLPSLRDSLAFVHAPPADADARALIEGHHPAVRRLAFEELLAHRLSLLKRRARHQQASPAPGLHGDGRLRRAFREGLGVALTGAQERVAGEVAADMACVEPMLRLIQGDVGSGKTIVAALAALNAVECGWQAAVMAPTELLAEQHYRSFRDWLAPLGIEVGWLSGRSPSGERRRHLQALADGTTGVAVGTHALFQQDVTFARLGLVIADEQHRFGVHQRLALREKGEGSGYQPHQLIMTATPIPRTLAMTAYADLDTSVIDEMPPGRQPVTTVALPDTRRDEVIERVRAACASGRQVYWVCTLVEESDELEAEAAQARAERLAESLPELRIGLVHGRLKANEKESVMTAFEAAELDLLVATTVIEVGVDVPNASLMIIENPERLGLAQLHQLRGRVGRGAAQSSCVLLYHGPLSETARARLAVLRETGDGFRIAQRDLELRGPGELLGTRQTGALSYRIAELERDKDLLATVQRHANTLLSSAPEQAESLIARWVGDAERYAQA
jgi:ATP-dependent DNA helicase RecG